MDQPITTFNGIDAIATLYADRVVLTGKRKSILWGTGLLGEKSFRLESLVAVHLREANLFTNGFIQFQMPGDSGDIRTGVVRAVVDEDAVMFRVTKKGNDRAREFKDAVEEAISARYTRVDVSQRSTSSTSVADELKKLAELNAQGILSDEEFAAQKAKLLSS